MINQIENFIKDFFQKLMIEIESIEVKKEENNIFKIKIKSDESWLIIWPNWSNLENIRNIFRTIFIKKFDEKITIHLEINDYLEEKDKKLYNYIKSKIDQVRDTWKDIVLPFFSSYERKKIHSYVWELAWSNIYTKSIWEWKERKLHICKKDEKMTIDINSNDI